MKKPAQSARLIKVLAGIGMLDKLIFVFSDPRVLGAAFRNFVILTRATFIKSS